MVKIDVYNYIHINVWKIIINIINIHIQLNINRSIIKVHDL